LERLLQLFWKQTLPISQICVSWWCQLLLQCLSVALSLYSWHQLCIVSNCPMPAPHRILSKFSLLATHCPLYLCILVHYRSIQPALSALIVQPFLGSNAAFFHELLGQTVKFCHTVFAFVQTAQEQNNCCFNS
jgi:hypothetical protein